VVTRINCVDLLCASFNSISSEHYIIGKMAEAQTVSRDRDREEIAREIKQIFAHIKHNPEDTETIHKAAKALRSKSESGYRGLVRLLNKYGYLHVLLESNGQNVDDNSSDPTKNRASSSSQHNSATLPSNSSMNQQHLTSKNSYSHAKNYNARSNAMSIGTGNGTNQTGNGGINITGNGSSVMVGNITGSPQHLQVPIGLAPTSEPSSPSMISRQILNEAAPNQQQRSFNPKESQRSERYARTKYFLSKTGLLSITNKTADLLKQNKQVQHEIDDLKQQTEDFVQSVLRNPANQNFMNKNNSQALNSAVTAEDTPASETDNSEFANILSGIYDFELPSVILAPLNVEQVLMPEDQLASLDQINSMPNSNDNSGPPSKRPKLD